MHSLAKINQLTVGFQRFNDTILTVENVSFSLNPCETLALLGESGCGKSLTALALMRLLPLHGVYGQNSKVSLNDCDLLTLPEKLMRDIRGRRVSMIFQEPMTALNPVLTIGEQLSEALVRHQSLSSKALKERVLSLLNDVEITNPSHRLSNYPHQLSGGQKQRVVIAMALANNPDLLIADEPTTALDVTIQAQILNLLKKLQQVYGMSILLITHDLGIIKKMAQRVLVMYAGQIVEQNSVDAFFSQVKHPYSQQLLGLIPSLEKRKARLASIPGAVPTFDALPSGCRFHPRCAHVFSICDQVKPHLQTIDGGTVRCHLYPRLQKPPPLLKEEAPWVSSEKTGECLLLVDNLKVYFPIKKGLLRRSREWVKAVDGMSFELSRGKTLALIGESGCGKTTLGQALLGLQPITAGTIFFKRQNVRHLGYKGLGDYRRQVQLIFQDPVSSMNPRMTVADIIAEGMLAQGVRKSTISKKLKNLLSQVNLPSVSLTRYPHQFSGGQRQRICIARALAMDPHILICDEPTSALDVSVQAQILNLLKELQLQSNLSYLFITHNMAVVSYMADEVLVMKEGKAIERGSCEEILAHPKALYTKALLSSVLTV